MLTVLIVFLPAALLLGIIYVLVAKTGPEHRSPEPYKRRF